MLEALKQAEQRTVGAKQTEKAVTRHKAEIVFIAKDADERIVESLKRLCEANEVKLHYVDTMLELGRACGVHVKAAAAAVVKIDKGLA